MYDLMYANPHLQRQYAFLRKAGKEVLLVVSSFEAFDTDAAVTVPAHAFEFLKLRHRIAIEAKDLLTGQTFTLRLKPDVPMVLPVPAHSALVLKFDN